MRYYKIAIDGGPTWSSVMSDGANNPNALRTEFVIEKTSSADEATHSYVRVYGVTLDTLRAASSFVNKGISIDAGFLANTLPLANSVAQRTSRINLTRATILQAFGNWRGNDITLDLILTSGASSSSSGGGGPPGGGTVDSGLGPGAPNTTAQRFASRKTRGFAPRSRASVTPLDGGGDASTMPTSPVAGLDFGSILSMFTQIFGGGNYRQAASNLIHNLLPGTPLAMAIMQTLSTAYPGCKVNLKISPLLMLNYQDSGFYQNGQQWASYIKSISAQLGGNAGVDVFVDGNTFNIIDWTTGGVAQVTLAYPDLIGQPSWFAVGQITFDCVMRGDLQPGNTVRLPQTVYATQPADNTGTWPIPSLLTFTGDFNLIKTRFIGDSRSPDGAMWRATCWANQSDTVAQGVTGAIAALGGAVASSVTGEIGGNVPGLSATSQRFARRAVRRW